ncbi:MAG: type II toxin-antitoxin system VapB family antitoxin [Myxococcota bacterium]
MSRTTLILDKELVARARKLTGHSTITDTVHAGLRELIEKAKRQRMLELEGEIDWQGDLDAWRADS